MKHLEPVLNYPLEKTNTEPEPAIDKWIAG